MNMKLGMAAVAALLACGCVETAGTRVDINTETGDARVLECSTHLKSRVQVVNVTYSDNGDGMKKATVTLESLTHRRQELQARMVWADAEGTEVDADAKPYRAIILDGKDRTTFTGIAPRPNCVQARLQLRETDTAQ